MKSGIRQPGISSGQIFRGRVESTDLTSATFVEGAEL
jgi:hypothetical protein